MFDSLAMALAFVVYALPPVHYGRCLNALGEQLGAPRGGGSAELPITQQPAGPAEKQPGSKAALGDAPQVRALFCVH